MPVRESGGLGIAHPIFFFPSLTAASEASFAAALTASLSWPLSASATSWRFCDLVFFESPPAAPVTRVDTPPVPWDFFFLNMLAPRGTGAHSALQLRALTLLSWLRLRMYRRDSDGTARDCQAVHRGDSFEKKYIDLHEA